MERSTIIRKLMEDKGMKVSDVSKESGIAYSTVKSILENGIGKASYVNICKICESVGITADKLEDMIKNNKTKEPELSKEDYERIRKYKLISDYSPDGAVVVDTVLDREYAIAEKLREHKEQLEKVQRMDMEVSEEIVPLRLWSYYGKIACAGTGFIFDDIPSDTVQAPDANADFIIGVNGDSMEPDYHDGEKLYIKKVENINPGEVGIFTINNECFLKEYGEDGLVSKNKKYEDIPGNEDVRLIGKVVGKVKE